MKNKGLIIGIAAGVITILAAVLVILLLNRKEGYRDIVVYEVEGDVSVGRNEKTLSVSQNMKLRNGDSINVGAESYLRLSLDGDKYIFVDENTRLSLEATGKGENTKTSIYLEEGNIITEVQNKLTGDASFEVITPNTTMAIRGTVVAISSKLVDGLVKTINTVLQGVVDVGVKTDNGIVTAKAVAGDTLNVKTEQTEGGIEDMKNLVQETKQQQEESGESAPEVTDTLETLVEKVIELGGEADSDPTAVFEEMGGFFEKITEKIQEEDVSSFKAMVETVPVSVNIKVLRIG